MSTRSVITFIDNQTEAQNTWSIYKHSDGYPNTEHGIVQAIKNAEDYAWPLPRFEANEYAAAFVAANKKGFKEQKERFKEANYSDEKIREGLGGNIYLTTSADDHADLEYKYEYKKLKGQAAKETMQLTIWEVYGGWHVIFQGLLVDALEKFKDWS